MPHVEKGMLSTLSVAAAPANQPEEPETAKVVDDKGLNGITTFRRTTA